MSTHAVLQERTSMKDQPPAHRHEVGGPTSHVRFGRETCGDLGTAEKREWLVTNGIGGFAFGTVAGVQTRRYHGVLFAALVPPLGRTRLASQLHESVEYDTRRYALATCRWVDGSVTPGGCQLVEGFRLEGTTLVWTFAFADPLLERLH